MPKMPLFSSPLLSSRGVGTVDVGAISDTIDRALSAAGLNPGPGSHDRIADTIRQALAAAGLHARRRDHASNGAAEPGREIDVTPAGEAPIGGTAAGGPRAGHFVSRVFTSGLGTRNYRLYLPSACAVEPHERRALIVMLHGCAQSPDDFATGTRMNALAEEHGFLVAYPEQAANANGSRCWNWFRAGDQGREGGEPALIAGIVGEVAAQHAVDERRIFVAGLSAGAAMAVILGATYPEIFAAVGAHSGLPYGAARDVPSAFAAMQGTPPPTGSRRGDAAGATRGPRPCDVPTIVFHGDRDATVHGRNGAAIVEQATAGRPDPQSLRATVVDGAAAGGRTYRRTIYTDATGQPVVEDWIVHGAGHAWSGGSPNGSFTDAAGPDASAEMVRFFFAQRRAGTA